MANYKNKRSTRSSQRGRGKNHSVNRERSYLTRKKSAKIKKFLLEQKEYQKRLRLAYKLYMSGKAEDFNEARQKAFSVNSNFLKNTDQWFMS